MALLRAASSPASSVCGPGVAKDKLRKKRKGKISVDSSASDDIDQTLDERLWRTLPQELLHLILGRLPLAAQYRARCVGQKWKRLQCMSPPPPCMIVCKSGHWNARFYCESGRKWFTLPSNRHAPLGRAWEVVDADAGLVCYQSRPHVSGWFWFWVCNPLKPGSLSRLIPPDEWRWRLSILPDPPRIKLIVCRTSSTFQIVAAPQDPTRCTAVYDSTTSRWQLFEDAPCLYECGIFVWGNRTYAYDARENLKQDKDAFKRQLTAFNIKRPGIWSDVEVEIPSEIWFPTKRFLLSNNRQVILVLFSCGKHPRPYFSVWKLLDEGSRFAYDSFAELQNWEKVEMGSERAVVDLRGHRLVCASYGADDIWFTFTNDDISDDGSRAHKCIRHSFAFKSWSVVQCPGDLGESFGLYNWEPCLDIDPR